MNIYENFYNQLKNDNIDIIQINKKDYKELKNKSFEEIQQEAKNYGLILSFNNGHSIFYDTHPYMFSLYPLDENGLIIRN